MNPNPLLSPAVVFARWPRLWLYWLAWRRVSSIVADVFFFFLTFSAGVFGGLTGFAGFDLPSDPIIWGTLYGLSVFLFVFFRSFSGKVVSHD